MAAEFRITIEDGSDHLPVADEVPPAPSPVAPTPAPVPVPAPAPARRAPDLSTVPAFDRPVPVVVVGPKPLAVSIVSGESKERDKEKAKPDERPKPKEPPRENWAKFLADRAASGATASGNAAVGAARNAGMPALLEGATAAASGLARLGPYGAAAGAALMAATAGVKAFSSTVDAFVARGRDLAGINANLAGATARADIARVRADYREANELGPKMAQLIEQQAKAEATFRELLLPIKSFILDVLNGAIKTGLEFTVSILTAIRDIAEGLKFGKGTLDKLNAMVSRIKEIAEGGGEAVGVEKWLADLGGFAAPPAAPVGPIGIPFFPG